MSDQQQQVMKSVAVLREGTDRYTTFHVLAQAIAGQIEDMPPAAQRTSLAAISDIALEMTGAK